ncbi:MAG: hypothetical protein HYY30_02290 [Chloroflexi bacterium]|nr:hypothetical protein [Chloroflexota bacterium]
MAQTFEEISQEFRATARKYDVPDDVASSIVDLHRGPLSCSDASATFVRWYTAVPGDPIASLTIADIHRMFQKSCADWKVTKNGLDRMWQYLSSKSGGEQAQDVAREIDWQAWRKQQMSGTGQAGAVSDALTHSLAMPIALCEKGLVREVLVEGVRRAADLSAWSESILAGFQNGGGVGALAQAHESLPGGGSGKRGYPGYGGALVGKIVFGIGVPAVITAVGVGCAVAGGPAGWAGATYCWGVAGYYSKRVYDDWDPIF